MNVMVWEGDVVAGSLHDIRAGGRHDLGGIALIVGGSDWGHRVGRRWNVRVCRGRSGELGRFWLGESRLMSFAACLASRKASMVGIEAHTRTE